MIARFIYLIINIGKFDFDGRIVGVSRTRSYDFFFLRRGCFNFSIKTCSGEGGPHVLIAYLLTNSKIYREKCPTTAGPAVRRLPLRY